LRLCDVQGPVPLKRSVVANEKERRIIAEVSGIYAIFSLQARLLLRRELHPVWKHERVMVYGHTKSTFLQPDANTNAPMEMEIKLKFKAAFREESSAPVKKWNQRLADQELSPEVVEGKAIAKVMEQIDPKAEVPENMFTECILDNVVDLGELVVQHMMCNVDKTRVSPAHRQVRLHKRLSKRLSKELGVKTVWEMEPQKEEKWHSLSSQEQYDFCTENFHKWREFKRQR